MSELICEELAHRAGFPISVGNWIAPNGDVILGKEDQHHWETIKEYFGEEPQTDNQLSWMNQKVQEGFVRLVFRSDVMFQVGAEHLDDLWSSQPNYQRMIMALQKLQETNVDIHIFSKHFYVIGSARNIVEKNIEKLEIRVKK